MPIETADSDLVFHASWPPLAQALLRRAIDRHGGWGLWRRLDSVTINLVRLRGLVPWLKGYGRTFQLGRSLTAYPKAGRTEFRKESGTPCTAMFDRGDMRLVDPATGGVLAESRGHRRTLRGLRRARRWDALDAHYFFGYAFASYTAVPFILPSLRFIAATTCRLRGERLQGIRVEYPAEAQVHSRVQAYFFDASGLVRRNDYVADVVGGWATGAHLWDDYTTVNGLPVPARRTVLYRLGTLAFPFAIALDATFERLGVSLADAPPL